MIRGFALLGILVMNMPAFNTSLFAGLDGTDLFPAAYDQWALSIGEVLLSGKFNSMFSMLFATGFILQLDRLQARDPGRAKVIYLRRLCWLFVFGAVHACVFWTGDVLHIYAVLGVVLLALRRAPDRLLWTLFGLCMAYPVAMGVYRMLDYTPAEGAHLLAVAKAWETTNNLAYGQGSWLDAAREHAREMYVTYTEPLVLRGTIGFYVQVFSTMMLGLMLGRRRFFQDAALHLPQIRRMQWAMLALGLTTGVVFGAWEATTTEPMTPTPFKLVAGVCYYVSRVAIMAFYVATLVRASHHAAWRRRLAPMARAGRMPLTNYLLQTLLCTFLFYGWGLGLWGKVGPALNFVFAMAIFFVIQVPLSTWWLARFELGPMEWVWRRLTYGRAPLRH